MDKCKNLNHDCTDVIVAMNAIHVNVRLFLSADLLFLSNYLPHYYATLLDITASPPLKGEDFFFIKSCTRIVQILLLTWKNALKCCIQFNFLKHTCFVGNLTSGNYWSKCKRVNKFKLLETSFYYVCGGNIEH